MDKSRELFARNIFTLREKLGLNQDEVAHRLGVNPRTYQKYEYGQAYPRPDKMAKLAEIFGVETSSLVTDYSSQSTPTMAPRSPHSGDRASRILSIQAKILELNESDLEVVEMTVNNLHEMSQNEAHKRVKKT